tara:strand:- start:342 stop:1352 length:1011 start_codon:yes stop_codon:yes gene_type:complete
MQKILLTGHRKSGTTLFGKLLDSYPLTEILVYPTDISVLYGGFDPFFYSRSRDEFAEGFFGIVEKTMLPYDKMRLSPKLPFFSLKRFLDILHSDAQVLETIQTRSDLVDFVARSFAKAVDVANPRAFIFKETSQLIHANDILAPSDKAITIFRDPRDVFSAIKDGFESYYATNGEEFGTVLQSVLFRYQVDYLAYLKFSEARPDSVRSIKFEDLVTEPEPVLRGLCKFIEIPFDASMLEPTDGNLAFQGNTYGNLEIPSGKITSKNVGRWTERLSGDEVEIIEFFLGDALEGLGYAKSVDFNGPPRAVSDHYRAINSKFFFKSPDLESLFGVHNPV